MRRLQAALGFALWLALVATMVALGDVQYLGPMEFPREFRNGGHTIDYTEDCADPTPNDLFPGCLVMTGRTANKTTGIIDIPNIGVAETVVPEFDCSFGIRQAWLDSDEKAKAREIGGITMLSAVHGVCTCIHDWYNVQKRNHPSHCWFNLATRTATGPYNGTGVHALEFSEYLTRVPDDWSHEHLGAGRWCIGGMRRGGGGLTPQGSAGPTLVFFRCEEPGHPDAKVSAIVVADWHAPSPFSTLENSTAEYDLWNPVLNCRDIAWIDDVVAVSCITGGGSWWYGANTADDKSHRNSSLIGSTEFLTYGPPLAIGTVDDCSRGKGYHAPDDGFEHYEVHIFDVSELVDVLQRRKRPHEVQPVGTWTPPEFEAGRCGSDAGIAYSAQHDVLFVVERRRHLVHRYKVAGDGLRRAAEPPECPCR